GTRQKSPSRRDQSSPGDARGEPALATRWRHRVWSGHSGLIRHESQMSPGPSIQTRARATPGCWPRPSTMRESTPSSERSPATAREIACSASRFTLDRIYRRIREPATGSRWDCNGASVDNEDSVPASEPGSRKDRIPAARRAGSADASRSPRGSEVPRVGELSPGTWAVIAPVGLAAGGAVVWYLLKA